MLASAEVLRGHGEEVLAREAMVDDRPRVGLTESHTGGGEDRGRRLPPAVDGARRGRLVAFHAAHERLYFRGVLEPYPAALSSGRALTAGDRPT